MKNIKLFIAICLVAGFATIVSAGIEPGATLLNFEPPQIFVAQESGVVPASAEGPENVGEVLPVTTERQPTPFWLFAALFASSIATIISVGIAAYLYRWRALLISEQRILVPEAWGHELRSNSKTVKLSGKAVDALGHTLREVARELVGKHSLSDKAVDALGRTLREVARELLGKQSLSDKRIDEMIETHMTLQTALDNRDEEIGRYRKGYDQIVFRRFLYRFIRTHKATVDLVSQVEDDQQLGMIARLLEDALEECGVERYSPKIGDDYRSASVQENPRIKKTADPSLDFKIAEVLEKGYWLPQVDIDPVVVPAIVAIYRKVEGENGSDIGD